MNLMVEHDMLAIDRRWFNNENFHKIEIDVLIERETNHEKKYSNCTNNKC
jgi:hypothetical protein